jgi:hypothetical protein
LPQRALVRLIRLQNDPHPGWCRARGAAARREQ